MKFQLTQVHEDSILDINENLAKAAKLSLQLPFPDQQPVIMCDANEHAAGYVLLIEHRANEKTAALKAEAFVAFGSREFTTGQMTLIMNTKRFLAMHFAFDKIGHVLWGVKKPIIVLTESKVLTQFP